MDAMRQANIIRASRHKPLVYSVMTQVALLGDAFCFIISNGVVRACIDAGPAPGTQIVIQDDQAVLPFTDGRFRTGLNTRGGVAVSAKVDAKYKFSLIIAPPRSVFSYRNQTDPLSRPIFLLAGHLTGSAAPTKLLIDTDFKGSHAVFFPVSSFILDGFFLKNFLSDRINRMNRIFSRIPDESVKSASACRRKIDQPSNKNEMLVSSVKSGEKCPCY
jgi:hypothetical protein